MQLVGWEPTGTGLLNGAAYRRKHIVGIGADQTNCTDHDDQDDCQHHGIFRDILAFLIIPEFLHQLFHVQPPPEVKA
jgi:hypothetical protein